MTSINEFGCFKKIHFKTVMRISDPGLRVFRIPFFERESENGSQCLNAGLNNAKFI